MTILNDFLQLIRETRSFINEMHPSRPRENKFPDPSHPPREEKKSSSSACEMNAQPMIGFSTDADGQKPFIKLKGTKDASKIPENEIAESKNPVKKAPPSQETAFDSSQSSSGFFLELPPPIFNPSNKSMESFIFKCAPSLQRTERRAPIVFLLYDPLHRPFLEKVASSVSTRLGFSQVIPYEGDAIFSHPHITMIAAPIDRLPIKNGSPHQLIFQKIAPHFFTLAPIEAYQQDFRLKRALWNALKTLPLPDMPQC